MWGTAGVVLLSPGLHRVAPGKCFPCVSSALGRPAQGSTLAVFVEELGDV